MIKKEGGVKIVIVGAGFVGTAFAHSAAHRMMDVKKTTSAYTRKLLDKEAFTFLLKAPKH